jgi:hypothetical protein
MDDTTSDNLDQTDEDTLTYTASDEALELAAAGGLGGRLCTHTGDLSFGVDDEALEAAAGMGGRYPLMTGGFCCPDERAWGG